MISYKAQEKIEESRQRNPDEAEDTTLRKLSSYRVNRLVM
jgi:hypothetical protein